MAPITYSCAMPPGPRSVEYAQLAQELGHRVHVALREGGREVMLSMRPPELGHVVVRMVMHDGVLQAHIVADRPEAARMLEQALPHLQDALSDRGLSLTGMDVSTQQEAQQRPAFTMDGARASRGSGDEPGFGAAIADAAASSTTTAQDGRLNILA